jgi:chemotaxis protein methyltransferase CheR
MLVDDIQRANRTAGFSSDLFQIVATDVSAPALILAMAGRYDSISMRRGFGRSFDTFRQNYFTQQGSASVLNREIRDRVTFKRHSLQDPFNDLGTFDLVLMRYVTIYFAPDFKEKLWPRVSAVLRPRGLLLLGAAETLLDQRTNLEIERVERAFFYRNMSGVIP